MAIDYGDKFHSTIPTVELIYYPKPFWSNIKTFWRISGKRIMVLYSGRKLSQIARK